MNIKISSDRGLVYKKPEYRYVLKKTKSSNISSRKVNWCDI